ncbi:MAG: PAS domain-containing protein, partial [Desulfamplus sp.]|nr:PAS domain-containing protein [Desulfamplus sp.]
EMNNDVENLLSSSGINILILDENCEIRKYSPEITGIFNILEKDIGRPIGHLSHNLGDFDLLGSVKRVQKSNKPVAVEKKDNRGNTYLIRIIPYNIGPDSFAGNIITFVDITELKKIRMDLQQSRQASREIVQNMPAGLFIYALDGDGDLTLKSANPTAEELTGVDSRTWKGEKFQKIWPNALELGILEKFLAVLNTGKPCFINEQYYKDNRIAGYYRIAAFLLPENRLAVSFEDISHRKDMDTMSVRPDPENRKVP